MDLWAGGLPSYCFLCVQAWKSSLCSQTQIGTSLVLHFGPLRALYLGFYCTQMKNINIPEVKELALDFQLLGVRWDLDLAASISTGAVCPWLFPLGTQLHQPEELGQSQRL